MSLDDVSGKVKEKIFGEWEVGERAFLKTLKLHS